MTVALTATVAPTGNALFDGLMSGVRWAVPALTYSFPSSDGQFDGVYDGVYTQGSDVYRDVTMISLAQREYTRLVLEGIATDGTRGWFGVEQFTNLSFSEVNGFGQGENSAAGDIRLTQSSLPDTAWGGFPGPDGGGDIWFGTTAAGTIFDYRNPVPGTYQSNGIMHELGHALGLKHGHEAANGFAPLPADMDSFDFSMMTYRAYLGQDPIRPSAYDFPQSWMMADILALQRLYGANYGLNAGNTTYSWSPTTGQMSIDGVGQVAPGLNRVFLTIWDGGGTDTYDMSNYATGVSIDLRPGKWSITADEQRAELEGPYEGNSYVRKYSLGNVYNALLFKGNEASLIENATGGAGDDAIRGNVAANLLKGGGGHDSLAGDTGDDTLLGGAGNDTLEGGAGKDSLVGGAGDDVYIVDDYNADTVSEVGGSGYDRVMAPWDWTLGEGIERLSLTGTLDAWGFGNAVANRLDGNPGPNILDGGARRDRLYGNGGDDTLIGGAGADRLEGGPGADAFRFARLGDRGDTIIGYLGADDRIEISASGFGRGLTEGMDLVAMGRFTSNTAGLATSPAGMGQFIWETDASVLWWDIDGLGGKAAYRLASMPGATGMDAGEILVIA